MRNYSGFSKQRRMDNVVGRLLYFVRRKKRDVPKRIRKIVVFKLGTIGDSILALPMIRLLKRATKAQIIVIHSNENKDIFNKIRFIDKKILLDVTGKNKIGLIKKAYEILKLKADVGIDLSYSGNTSAVLATLSSKFSIGFFNSSTNNRNKFFDDVIEINPKEHVVKSYFRLIEQLKIFPRSDDLKLEKMPYDKKSSEKIKEILKGKIGLVGIHCCHQIASKSWPKENFVELINYLTRIGKNVVLVGSPSESELVKDVLNGVKLKERVINLSGKTSLVELFALMDNLDFFIANDGGVMHMAASMGLPTIGIFGPETPIRYAPFNRKSFSFYDADNKPAIRAYDSVWSSNESKWVDSKISPLEIIELIKWKML